MEAQRTCPKCGRPLPANAPRGLCPRCLLDLGRTPSPEASGTHTGAETIGADAASTITSDGLADGLSPQPLTRFGDYELLEEIGRGGMGIVYKARQISLNRLVALKMILFGHLATPDQIRRFRTEASSAAALQHPHIVAVHEVGVLQNQHYLVMDYVDGPNLAGLVKNRPLPAKTAAAYLKPVAEAIHFAHEHGILHRDVKPSNVLVGSDDRPRVADFGLARRLETDSSLTVSGAMLGSPNYMPPEQVRASKGKVGRASDVYGLGAVLYHLLTARPPFQAETIPETLHLVTEAEPLSPRALVASVPRDLETICLKCLEKDPVKRYPTAQALAEELDRFLKGEPIQARPVGPAGKAWRWCQRKPAIAAALVLSIVSLVAVAVVSSVSAVRTNRARQAERLEAYYSAIALADQYIQQGNIAGAKELLFQCPTEFRHWEWGRLMYLCHQDILTILAHTNALPVVSRSQDTNNSAAGSSRVYWASFTASRVSRIAFSPDGSSLISHGTDGTVRVWGVEDGRLRFTVGGPSEPITHCEAESLGRYLAIGGEDGTARVIELPSGRVIRQVVHGTNVACWPVLWAGGRPLVTAGGSLVRVWDVETGDCVRQWDLGAEPLQKVALSDDGTRLLIAHRRRASVWDVRSGQELHRIEPAIPHIADSTVGPEGKALVTFDADNQLRLWRTNGTSIELGVSRGSSWRTVRWAEFGVDGRLLCTGGDQGSARVWETESGKERFALPGRILGARFSPDGQQLATVSGESTVRIWDLASGKEVRTLRGHVGMVENVAFSPDSRLVATADKHGIVKFWSARNGREVLQGDSWTWGVCYSADGKRVASISAPLFDLRVWDAESGAELLRFRPGMEHATDALRFSPDGRYLATGGHKGDVRLWDSRTGQEIRRYVGHAQTVDWAAFSPDGKQLATGGKDGTVRLWEVETGVSQHEFGCGDGFVDQLGFSPDGHRLYAAGTDGFVRGWDAHSGQLALQVGKAGVTALFFGISPDSRHLYTWNLWESSLRTWDAVTGRPLNDGPLPRRPGYCLTFTPDGRRMAMVVLPTTHLGYGTGESSGVIVDVGSGRELLAFRGHTEPMTSLLFDPSGRRLVSGGGDHTTRQWEAFPWREEEYAEGGGARGEGRGVRDKVGGQKAEGRRQTLPERVQAYADRYWRERLRAEATARPPAPVQTMVRWDRSLWPKRDERAGPNQIDLTEHYTTRLDVLLSPIHEYMEGDNDLRELPAGTVTLGNVTFDVRGVLLLRRLTDFGPVWRRQWEQHPVRADGIRVVGKFRRLHVLHSAAKYLFEEEAPDGTPVGSYVLHYADGTQVQLPIVLGRHLRQWWFYSGQLEPIQHAGGGLSTKWGVSSNGHDSNQPLLEGKVVWTGSNPSAKDAGATLRLYLTSYENPHPDKEVVSVDYVSAMAMAAPFLVAMTIEP